MGILEKYQIVTMLGAGETSSFRAREVSTGRSVVVHQFLRDQTSPGQPDLMSMVYNYLSRADAPGIENYLDSGEDGDTVYIVTSDVPECLVLRQWLQTMAIVLGDGETSTAGPGAADTFAASSPEPFEQSPPETKHEPGEFTSMFNAPVNKAPTPAAAPPSPQLISEPSAKSDDKFSGGQVPGGFEVVYRSRKRTTEMGPQPEPVAPTAAADMQATMLAPKPREFTGQSLGSSKAQSLPTRTPPMPGGSPLRPAPSGGNSSPGEFTQMFSGVGTGKAGQPVKPSAPATAKAPAATAPGKESVPGQFTGEFGGVGAGHANPPSAPPQPARAANAPSPRPAMDNSGPGEFTQMFTSPHATPGQPATPPSSPGAAKLAAPPESPAQKKGPGQFTMMFRTGAQGSANAEPPLAGPGPAPTTTPTVVGSPRPIQQKPVTPAPKSDADSPGEFTQMFKSGGEPVRPPGLGPPSRPPAPLSSSSKKGPGEFTMLTQAYKPSPGTPAAPQVLETPKAPTPASAADPRKGPGEFTMLFRAPTPSATPVPQAAPPPPVAPQAPAPPRAHQAGEYTSIFEAPRMPPAAPQPAPQATPPPGYGYPAAPVAPVPPQMPVYQPPAPPTAPQVGYPQPPQYQPAPPPMPVVAMPPPPQPIPSAGTSKPPIFWILLLTLGCLFLAAVVLVLFFALKH